MKTLITTALFFLAFTTFGQNAYTQDLFSFSVENDIEYGTATNYVGNTESLKLDLYKPVGDDNCNRPCLVLVHGGAWVQGSKDDAGIVSVSEKLAAKGWVVAAIDYRLGTHKPAFYDSAYQVCDYQLKCWNTSDSAEIFRANYRGQQDTKGAIRFMKERHMLDSTDISNFFLLGESAGGFISFAAAFLDDPSEKPMECGALPNAPTPNSFLDECLPAGFSTSRPDLGDINGTVALNGYNTSVEGIGTFISGTFDVGMFSNTTDWPSIYMFHQGSDIVVAPGYFRLLARANTCFSLNNTCPPFQQFPCAHGSFSLNQFLTNLGSSVDIQFDYLSNSNGIPLDCVASGHSIDNINLRLQNMTDHFAQRIFDNGNTPSSTCTNSIDENANDNPEIYPNPSNGVITVKLHPSHKQLSLLSTEGKFIRSYEAQAVQHLQLKSGVYFIQVVAENGQEWIKKIVVL
ncbi:MAG: T9SS type A sorting domain-containing protein [Crocinitomicaceae bacterium]